MSKTLALLTIKDILTRSAAWLAEKGCETARLDAEVLLAHVLGCQRLDLYLNWTRPLEEHEKDQYRDLLKRRAGHEPVAYIVGGKEFFGLRLRVTPDVLIPRPETELLVERALETIDDAEEAEGLRIVDVGAGSGAIAIAIAHELPGASIIATDTSAAALELARENARTHVPDSSIDFRNVSLLEGIEAPLDWVISNPPYVAERDRDALPPDVARYEPAGALFAGEDGLDVIRDLIPAAADKLCPGGWLFLEIGLDQAKDTADLITKNGRFAPPEIRRDYQGIDRIIAARKLPAPDKPQPRGEEPQ